MVAHIDQKSKKTNGIICDLCGSISIDKFEYYSAKFDMVEVDRAAGTAGIKQIDRRHLDLDLCKTCMDAMKQKVIDGIKKREKGGAWTATGKPPEAK